MERRLGNIFGFDGGNYAGNVYDQNYMCPTLNTMQGGCKQPMIIEDAKCIGGLGEKKSNGGTQYYQQDRVYHGDIALAHPSQLPGGSYNYMVESILQMPRGYNKGGEHSICSPITSHSFQENNLLKENAQICIGGLQKHQTPRTDGISPSLTAAMGMGGGQTPLINQKYRIRKLTPLECWRLMDFSDEDFCKAEKVNSNTQLYKQEGNSIVKNLLVAIFGQMIEGKENVYKKMEVKR